MMLIYVLIYFVIIVGILFFPLRLAAQYADAENTSYKQTLSVAIIVAVAQTLLTRFIFSGMPLVGGLVAIIATVVIGMKLFDIPSSNFLTFGALFFVLNYVAQIIAAMIISALF